MLGSIPTVVSASPVSATAPLLWQGQVRNVDGSPAAAATVSAVLRPPPEAIPMKDAVLGGVLPMPSIRLAATSTALDGRFELRSVLPSIPASFAPGGWLDVLLFIESRDGG